MMNTNRGNDPMLSSFLSEDRFRFIGMASPSATPATSKTASLFTSPAFIISMDNLISTETTTGLSDFAASWSNEHKGIVSIKTEEDSRFLTSPYAPSGDLDNGDIAMEDIQLESSTAVDIKIEIEDVDFDNTDVGSNSLRVYRCSNQADQHLGNNSLYNQFYKHEINTLQMSEAAARRYVEEQFEKIAFVPSPKLSQREKIQFILAQSDCSEYSVESVLHFDKRSPDSARACARIVQNIPQRYRWECILPEDIPCCYTIVADCKKVSSRDKPPRPMNAFMIWAQGARRLINELCPKMQNALISEALGYYWRQKSDSFKNIFEQEKIKLRRFHNVEFPEYKYKPKTKVQKAKEKHELSLTKAKLRATVKRERLHSTEESSLCPRRSKCGRPRKAKSVSCRRSATHVTSDQLPEIVPTKPAIKDMLTLKILSDRQSKCVLKTAPASRLTVHSAHGQLSPIEVDNPYINDIFDDLGNFNLNLINNACTDKDTISHTIPSSVYDTPANTPPVDIEHDLRLSPLQPQMTLQSSFSPKLHDLTPQKPSLYKPNITSTNPPTNAMLKPRHSATQISTAASRCKFDSNHNLSHGDHYRNSTTVSSDIQSSQLSSNRASEFSDLLFTYVTEALSSGPVKLKSFNNGSSTNNNNNGSSTNNNSSSYKTSDVNNVSQSDHNNNNVDPILSYPTNFRSTKTGYCFSESSDLDTLLLDPNSPILSDDDMMSLLNSL